MTFVAGEDRLRLWVLPGKSPVEAIIAEAPTNAPDERKPIVILRQRSTATRFLTVWEPLGEHTLDEKTVTELEP
jgi:hypothetical protein